MIYRGESWYVHSIAHYNGSCYSDGKRIEDKRATHANRDTQLYCGPSYGEIGLIHAQW